MAITDHSKNLAFANGSPMNAAGTHREDSRDWKEDEGHSRAAGSKSTFWAMARSIFGLRAGTDGYCDRQRALAVSTRTAPR